MQQHLFEHFSSEGHSGFLDDVSIIFTDKTNPRDPNKREYYWQHSLKTIVPQGLNVKDDWFIQLYFLDISHSIYSHDCLFQDKSIRILIYENDTRQIIFKIINDISLPV